MLNSLNTCAVLDMLHASDEHQSSLREETCQSRRGSSDCPMQEVESADWAEDICQGGGLCRVIYSFPLQPAAALIYHRREGKESSVIE